MANFSFKSAVLLLLWLVSGSIPVLAATDQAATEQVKAQLIASVAALRPGDEILLGVHQQIIPHWHTYWKNPGDSGLATKIDYQLPVDTQVGEIQWPTPSRFTLGPVVNYGYADQVTLLTPVKLPGTLPVGSDFTIQAKVKWLVCAEICIPQQVELALTLPVVAADQEAGPGHSLINVAKGHWPLSAPGEIVLEQQANGLQLRVLGHEFQQSELTAVWFYPEQWGPIAHGADQVHSASADGLEVVLMPGDAPLKPGQSLSGVLAVSKKVGAETVTQGYQIQVVLTGSANDHAAPLTSAAQVEHTETDDLAVPSAMLLALLGGLILNLMPCVFPVLSMKALALAGHAGHDTQKIRRQGWLYTAGVMISFVGLAGILLLLKAGGSQIGWGFQFQSPWFVLTVAYLMFAVGLSLSGVFSLGASVVGVGSSLAQRSGYSGSFFTGVLATVVATPCTAPFMGAAIGFALSQSTLVLLAVFLSLGFGLALPFLLLSYWPRLQRALPRPGSWMEHLKQGLAFPMYAASAWLVWVLVQQAGANAVAVALLGMVAIGFAAWLFEINKLSATSIRRVTHALVAGILLSALYGSYWGLLTAAPVSAASHASLGAQNWQPFSRERLQTLRAAGKPVFVNFTAAWCISCLVNERVALNQDEVRQALEAQGITYLKGDWTNRDAEITDFLAEFGRSGVPLYLFYPPGNTAQPLVLPQILTPQIITEAFATAG